MEGKFRASYLSIRIKEMLKVKYLNIFFKKEVSRLNPKIVEGRKYWIAEIQELENKHRREPIKLFKKILIS